MPASAATDGSSALALTQPDPPVTPRANTVFRLCGQMRDIGFAGRVVSLRDLHGFRIYAELFARPGTRIPAVELRAGMAGVEPALFAGSTGPTVTASGLADLRQQYEQISEDLAEAELANDEAKARVLHAELTTLADHVRRAVGKDGTPRRVSDAERARVAIAKALARACSVLATHHPDLLQHIVRSVQTGSVLCYRPAEPVCWDLGGSRPA